jgi:hypothetical protein
MQYCVGGGPARNAQDQGSQGGTPDDAEEGEGMLLVGCACVQAHTHARAFPFVGAHIALLLFLGPPCQSTQAHQACGLLRRRYGATHAPLGIWGVS